MKEKIITDKSEWENFLKNSNYRTSFFQSWNWGEFQKELGKEIIRFGFFNNEKLLGVAQAVIIKAKRGKYLYIRNGPVLSWENKDFTKFIISSIKKRAEELNLWFVRISPLISDNSQGANLLKRFPVSPMYDVDALDTWLLDIDREEEVLLLEMRKSTRYEIRKAKKIGVKIIKSKDPKDIEKFYPIYLDTIKRQKWTGYTKHFLVKQFESFIKDNQIELFFAEYKNILIAGSIFIFWNNECFYHYSGSLTDYRSIPGPYLIQWESILEARQRKIRKYNFWGIPPKNRPNHPWQGLGFYKMGFGGYEARWFPTRDIPVSKKYWVTNLFEKIQKKRKGY